MSSLTGSDARRTLWTMVSVAQLKQIVESATWTKALTRWRFGTKAAALLSSGDETRATLRKKLELSEPDLRHAIQFASRFTEDQARQLEAAGTAWRTCIAMLADLSAAQRRRLVAKVCDGDPTSEDVRKLVHELRGTTADARLRGDVNEAILEASRRYSADLRAFDEYEIEADNETREQLVTELNSVRDPIGKLLRRIRE